MNRYVKKGLKITAWIIGSIIVLFLLLVVLIQIPAIQNVLKDKAITYLEEKIKTPVHLDRIEIGLPKKVVLQGLYLQTQNGDTLLSGRKIAVDISLFKLLSNEVEINSVALTGIVANVTRDKDSIFNFDYIIDAFASDKPADPESKPMTFSLNSIDLNDVRVRFDDAITRNDLHVTLNHFDTKVRTFDLEKMDFHVPKITLDGLKLNLKQGDLVREIAITTVETADSLVKTRPDLNIKLEELNIKNIDLVYDNAGTKLNSGLKLQELYLKFDKTDLPKQQIEIDKFELKGVSAGLTMGKEDRELDTKNQSGASKNDWKITLSVAEIERVNFRFDNENDPKLSRGMDYSHLNLTNFNLKAADISYSSDVISGNIKSASVKDRSGLDLQEMRTDFYYGPRSAYLKNLYIRTPKTLLRDKIIVSYPSLNALQHNPGVVGIDAVLNRSKVAFSDILLFVPGLAQTNPFASNPNATLSIHSRMQGKLDNLSIPNLEISGLGNTVLAASGRIVGLPKVETSYLDLNIRNLQSGSADLNALLPKGTIPANIQLPGRFALKGTFKGAVNNFNTDLALNSSFGNAQVKALFDNRTKGRERYDGNAMIDNFDVGSLLKNDSIGRISLRANVKGVGLDPKTATAKVDATLIKAVYNSYTYKDLAVKGNIRDRRFVAVANMDDANLDFDLESEGSFAGKYPTVKLKLNVDMIDLDALNFYADPLRMRGVIDADITSADPDMLNGRINAYHFVVANEKEQFQLDSVNITAVSTAEQNSIRLRSQFIKANIEGKYQLTQVANALSNSIATYYDTNPANRKPVTQPQQFKFGVRVISDPVIMKLLPQISSLEPITITGRYNSVGDTIALNAKIPRLVYGSNTISNAVIKVDKLDDALTYSAIIDEIQNDQIALPYTSIEGKVANNVLSYRLNIRDQKDKDQYIVAGTLKNSEGETEIRMLPEDLMLNYERWLIADNNVVRFGNRGIYADDFKLSNNNSSITLQSESEATNAPLNVNFTDFELETITRMVQKDSLAIAGKLQGEVVLRDVASKPVFTSDLNIQNLSYKKDTVGNISIKVDNKVANTFTADVAITGKGNQVNLAGTYNNLNSSFDLDLEMDRLNLKSIEPFTGGQIAKSSGYVSGDLRLTGTIEKPKLIGELKFNEGAFTVTTLNSPFSLMNDRITFTEQGIVFNKFSLSDAEKNVLTITGNIDTPDYRDYKFNVGVNADNFRAMNSSAKDNDLYYGQLYLNTRLNIKGDLNKPIIDGTLKVNEDTKLTVVLPHSDPSIADREGIVEFIDQDNPQLTEPLMAAQDSLNKTTFRGLNIAANIEIDKDAELTMIVDKGNGDFVKVKGEARLSGGIDESGKTTLTGRYELKQGSYEMSFNFLKRKFDIQEGSYILWTGEPTSANINIIAVYTADAAPLDLLDDQLGNMSQTVRNTYKQRIPFETVLELKGELLKPEISFDIRVPDGNHGVSSEIVSASRNRLEQLRQEPSELNKQVFALLLLNRFVGENPFATSSGISTETMARQSVSKILSQQLNNLASDLIDGVELNFDLESTETYTTGQAENRTDLNVAVSKRLLDDRLKVTVGSSFGIEGEEQANQQATNIAGDVSAEYQLSKDGRYTLRAYRLNEYQVALQGQVIETGIAFVITMDYDRFRELFHRTKEEKMLKRQMKRKKAEDKQRERMLERQREEELKEAKTEEKE